MTTLKSDAAHKKGIRHILVGLDASAHSQAALRAAIDLASALDVELHALFVRDSDLVSAADVSFVREIRTWTFGTTEMNGYRIRRQLDAQAVQLRRMLERYAGDAGVRFEFNVRQGDVTKELLLAAREADLVLLGKASLGKSSRKLGRTVRRVLEGCSTPVMIVRQGIRISRPILVVYDGSDGSESALRLAVQLERWRGAGKMYVVVWAEDPEQQRLIQHRITARLGTEFEGLHFRPISEPEADDVAEVARQQAAGVIIVGTDSPVLKDEGLYRLTNLVDIPVLIVRPETVSVRGSSGSE